MMKSKLFFRESGHVIRTHTRWDFGQWVWAFTGVLAVVLVLALGASIDAESETPALAEARHFEAGRMAEQQAALQMVAVAYRQGYEDALAELAAKPGANANAVETSTAGNRP